MSVVIEFGKALSKGMAELSDDEWAITKARDQALIGVTPRTAFDSIAGILNLAGQQSDEYAFASCCWFAMDLAKLSDTTEPPPGLAAMLLLLSPLALKFGAEDDLRILANWYRLAI